MESNIQNHLRTVILIGDIVIGRFGSDFYRSCTDHLATIIRNILKYHIPSRIHAANILILNRSVGVIHRDLRHRGGSMGSDRQHGQHANDHNQGQDK